MSGPGKSKTRARAMSAPGKFMPPVGTSPADGASNPAPDNTPAPLPSIATPPPTSASQLLPGIPAPSVTSASQPLPSLHAPVTPIVSTLPSAVDDTATSTRKNRTKKVKGFPPTRQSTRSTTVVTTTQSLAKAEATANAPPRAHPTSTGRAIDPVSGASTADANQARLAQATPSTPTSRGVLVVYGGKPSPGGHLQGMPLEGPRIDRGSWTADQKTLSQRLGTALAKEGHLGAPHSGGEHHSEIAHHRQQATGGFTDPLGAVPASTGSNVEDMSLEEGHAKISKSLRSNQVREVNVANIRSKGTDAGTLDTRERHLFARSSTDKPYHLAQRHLQDGQRDMPDKNEVRALRTAQIEAATRSRSATMPASTTSSGNPSSSSSTAPSPWTISSTPTPQSPPTYNARTQNDSAQSAFLSGTRSPNGTWRTGSDAAQWYESFNHFAANQHPQPAAAASALHPNTGSRTPPFLPPPSPPSLPPVRATTTTASSATTATSSSSGTSTRPRSASLGSSSTTPGPSSLRSDNAPPK